MPCQATNVKKGQWICMFMKVNLPILVNSFADREYVLNIPFLSDNKGHVHLLQA